MNKFEAMSNVLAEDELMNVENQEEVLDISESMLGAIGSLMDSVLDSEDPSLQEGTEEKEEPAQSNEMVRRNISVCYFSLKMFRQS